MRHEAEVLHQLPGRTRIRLATAKGDADALEKIAGDLRALPSVQAVSTTPLTGSLVVRHSGDFHEIAADAAGRGVFHLVKRSPAPLDLQGHLNQGLRQFERDIKAVTGGGMDLNGMLILVFGALAIQQAIEGQVVIPAATALWYALESARRPKDPEPPPGSSDKQRLD